MKKEEVILHIGEKHWPQFLKFIVGQTVSFNKNGSIEYYKTDVDRFKRTLIAKQK